MQPLLLIQIQLADTGVELWLFKPTGNVKSISVSGNQTFAATNSLAPTPSYIYALDTTTGKQLWQKQLGYTIWAPLSIAQGLLLIGGKTGIVEALDIKRNKQSGSSKRRML